MITVTISRRALKRAKACKDGLALFDRIAAMQPADDAKRLRRIKVRWTPLAEVWLAVSAPSFTGWLRQRNFIPRIDLYGADLRGADLGDANRSQFDPTITGWVVRDGVLVRGESS